MMNTRMQFSILRLLQSLMFVSLLAPVLPLSYAFYMCGYMGCLTYGVVAVVGFHIALVILFIVVGMLIATKGIAIVCALWRGMVSCSVVRSGCVITILVVTLTLMLVIAMWARLNNSVKVLLPDDKNKRQAVLELLENKGFVHHPTRYHLACYPAILLPSPSVNEDRVILYRTHDMEAVLIQELSDVGFSLSVACDFPRVWRVR